MALPIVTHLDPVIGTDVHLVYIPPIPVPIPVPHSHSGSVMDLAEMALSLLGVVGGLAGTLTGVVGVVGSVAAGGLGLAASGATSLLTSAVTGTTYLGDVGRFVSSQASTSIGALASSGGLIQEAIQSGGMPLADIASETLNILGEFAFKTAKNLITQGIPLALDTAAKVMDAGIVAASAVGVGLNAASAGVNFVVAANSLVTAMGQIRATTGTNSQHTEGLHTPNGVAFGAHDSQPSNDTQSMLGSATVSANGDPLSFLGLSALSCWFSGSANPANVAIHTIRYYISQPSATLLPMPKQMPVLVGGGAAMAIASAPIAPVVAFPLAGASIITKLTSMTAKLLAQSLEFAIDCGDPVDVISGHVFMEQIDFQISGRFPFMWQRYYDGSNDYKGVYGRRWESTADIRLSFKKHYSAFIPEVTFPDLVLVFNDLPAEDGWEHRLYEGTKGYALYCEEGQCIILSPSLKRFHFPRPSMADLGELTQGESYTVPMVEIGDLHQNRWELVRNESGVLQRIVEYSGKDKTGRHIECHSLYLSHNGSPLIERMVLHAENHGNFEHLLAEYSYDEGNLEMTCDENGAPYHYAYKENSLMISHTNREGFSFYYDYELFEDGMERVISTYGDQGLLHYEIRYDLEKQQTEYIDSLGNTSLLQYNEVNYPLLLIDTNGGYTSYKYDHLGRKIAEVDPEGYRHYWTYNDKGLVTEEKYPHQASLQRTYDENGFLIAIKDMEGGVWKREVNDKGLVSKMILPDASWTKYDYDKTGRLIHSENVEGHEVYLEYDALGFVYTIQKGTQAPSRYQHDVLGRLTKHQRPNGDETSYTYDAKGQLISCRYPNKKEHHYSYDGEGNLTQYIDGGQHQYSFEYLKGLDLLLGVRYPNKTGLSFTYDTECELIKVTNQEGKEWHMERDALGRIIEESDYWGAKTCYQYNKSGHLITSQDPLGNQLAIKCNALGQIIEKISNDDAKTKESFQYNRLGRLVTANYQDNTVVREYNKLGEIVEEIQNQTHLQAILQYKYNQSQQLTSRTTMVKIHGTKHEQVVDYGYNDLGQLISQQIDKETPILFHYDDNDQLVRQELDEQLVLQHQYNTDGTLKSQQLSKGKEKTLDHIVYHYDHAGNLTRREDNLLGVDQYSYDPLGQIIDHIDPLHKIEQYVYSHAGNRYHEVTSKGNEQESERSMLFDENNIQYVLDDKGQLTKKRHLEEESLYDWDSRGTLAKAQGAQGVATYHYDGLRRRVRKELYQRKGDPSKTVYFVWDKESIVMDLTLNHDELLSKVIDIRTFTYAHSSFVPLALQQTRARIDNGDDEFDGENFVDLSAISPFKEGFFFYQVDINGTPTRLRNLSGELVWLSSCSVFGQAMVANGDWIEQPLRLQGQYFDNETGLHYNRHRYYDAETGIFISQDPIGLEGGINSYQFAPNILQWADPLGLTKCPAGSKGDFKIGHDYSNRYASPEYDHTRVASTRPGGASSRKTAVTSLAKNRRVNRNEANKNADIVNPDIWMPTLNNQRNIWYGMNAYNETTNSGISQLVVADAGLETF